MKNHDDCAAPAPIAESRNSTAEMINTVRRPHRSARRPAKNAPIAQPSSIEATSKPTPAELEWKACFRPSTVPLITPLSKPNRKPPIVATQLIRMMKRVFSALARGAVLSIAVVFIPWLRLCSEAAFAGADAVPVLQRAALTATDTG